MSDYLSTGFDLRDTIGYYYYVHGIQSKDGVFIAMNPTKGIRPPYQDTMQKVSNLRERLALAGCAGPLGGVNKFEIAHDKSYYCRGMK